MEYEKLPARQRRYLTPSRRKRCLFPSFFCYLSVIDVGFTGVFFFNSIKTGEGFS